MEKLSQAEKEELKKKNPIEDLVQEWGFNLIEAGNGLICPDRPGLCVDPLRQRYSWLENDEGGDVIEWVRHRESWSFEQACNYLRLRLISPRIKMHRQAEEKKSVGLVDEFRPDLENPDDSDWRVRKTLKIGGDYPGIEALITGTSKFSVFDAISFLPHKFLSLSGQLDDEFCIWCEKEFTGWSDGGLVYLAVELGDEYEIGIDIKSSGVYCSDCVKRFKDWNEALRLVINYRMYK